jgi:toxin ParE1/3/4
MDKKYQIEYLPVAMRDLTEIVEYIQLDSPQNASSFLDRIDESISKLEDFPYLGAIPKDVRLQRLGYRMLIVENYLVFYVVIDDIVEIRRIIYGGRKYSFLT